MAPPHIHGHADCCTPERKRVLPNVLWRVDPLPLLCFVFAFLDRINFGVAARSVRLIRFLGTSMRAGPAGQLKTTR